MDEADKAQGDAQELQRHMEQAGWKWKGDGIDRMLVDPADPELSVWFDPYSGESLLSPKLVESLKQSVRAARGQADRVSADHTSDAG